MSLHPGFVVRCSSLFSLFPILRSLLRLSVAEAERFPCLQASNLYDTHPLAAPLLGTFISTDEGAYSSVYAVADPEVEEKNIWCVVSSSLNASAPLAPSSPSPTYASLSPSTPTDSRLTGNAGENTSSPSARSRSRGTAKTRRRRRSCGSSVRRFAGRRSGVGERSGVEGLYINAKE